MNNRTEATFLAHAHEKQRAAARSRLTRGRLCSKEERRILLSPTPSGRIRLSRCSDLLLGLMVRSDVMIAAVPGGTRQTMCRSRRSAASRHVAYQQAARVQRELADDHFLLKSRVVRPRDQEVLSRAPQAINHRVPHVLRRDRNKCAAAIRALPNAPFIVVSTAHAVGATGQSAPSMWALAHEVALRPSVIMHMLLCCMAWMEVGR